MSVNKIILVGNVGDNPKVTHLDNGTAVAKFSLATSEVWKNKNGEKQENTTWHNIVLWKGLAEIAEKYVIKGMQVYIEGKQLNRSYTDKDGVKKYTSEVVGDIMQMLGKKEGTTEQKPISTFDPKPVSHEDELGTLESGLPF